MPDSQPMPERVTRFSYVENNKHIRMVQDYEGDWVRYADVVALIAATPQACDKCVCYHSENKIPSIAAAPQQEVRCSCGSNINGPHNEYPSWHYILPASQEPQQEPTVQYKDPALLLEIAQLKTRLSELTKPKPQKPQQERYYTSEEGVAAADATWGKVEYVPQAPQQQRFTEVLTPEFVHRLTDEIFATQKPSIEWQYADADKIARTLCDLLAKAEAAPKDKA